MGETEEGVPLPVSQSHYPGSATAALKPIKMVMQTETFLNYLQTYWLPAEPSTSFWEICTVLPRAKFGLELKKEAECQSTGLHTV